MNGDNKNFLIMDTIVFDKIEFSRLGFSSDEELKMDIQSKVFQRNMEDEYKVTLTMNGHKPDEYMFTVSLSGFFSINNKDNLTEEMKEKLINNNTVAILMPYLRSEVSLLTAQPNMECVVFPVFNINNIMEKGSAHAIDTE